MTDYQNELVMEHLDLVNWVIRTRISVPNRPLLTYDDFYAIGCVAICRAALKYQGVARKGVEAIELKLQGYESVEIADLYGTTVNNVNAWISRARSKLRNEPALMEILC